QCAHVLFGHGEREIPHKNLHGMSLLGFCHPWPPQNCEEKRCHRPCSSATRCSEAARRPYSSKNVPPTLRESRERWGDRDACVTADALCPLEETIVLHVDRSPRWDSKQAPPLLLLILLIQEICLIVLVHLLDRGVQAEDVLVLVPFVE